MVQIEIRGVIVPDDDLWIYELFAMTATAPQMVRNALKDAAGDEVVVIEDHKVLESSGLLQ